MTRIRAAGGLLAVLSFAGYVVGVGVDYPGRSLSLTLLMAGLTMVAIGGASS